MQCAHSPIPLPLSHRPPSLSADSLSISALTSLATLPLDESARSSSHAINTRPGYPPLLLDVIPPVRSLIWQYMDNRSAVQYLRTCKQLHGLYHSFPPDRVRGLPVSSSPSAGTIVSAALEPVATSVGSLGCVYLVLCVLGTIAALATVVKNSLAGCIMLAVFFTLAVVARLLFAPILKPCLFPKRASCCDRGRLLTRYTEPVQIPRIIRLADGLDLTCTPEDMPLLQHAEVLCMGDSGSRPIEQCTLPHSLRKLLLSFHDYSVLLKAGPLPKLTVLVLIEVPGILLQPGVFPQSLVTLQLYYEPAIRESFVHPAIRPIAAGVLPSQLQCLRIEWPRSLADLVLPAFAHQTEPGVAARPAPPCRQSARWPAVAVHLHCVVRPSPPLWRAARWPSSAASSLRPVPSDDGRAAGSGAASGGAGPGRLLPVLAAHRHTGISAPAARVARQQMGQSPCHSRHPASTTAAPGSGGRDDGRGRQHGADGSAASGTGG